MSNVEFKVGDLVYVLSEINADGEYYTTEIIQSPHNFRYPLAVGIQGGYMLFDYDGSQGGGRVVELVETEDETEQVEQVDSREIITKMLKDYKYVLCRLDDYDKNPNDTCYLGNVSSIKHSHHMPFYTDNNSWRYATPIDPKTGKKILDYRDGQIIV